MTNGRRRHPRSSRVASHISRVREVSLTSTPCFPCVDVVERFLGLLINELPEGNEESHISLTNEVISGKNWLLPPTVTIFNLCLALICELEEQAH